MAFVTNHKKTSEQREFGTILEAQKIFKDITNDIELRTQAFEYMVKNKSIKYILRVLQAPCTINNNADNLFTDFAFISFMKKEKTKEDIQEMLEILKSDDAYLRNQAIGFLQEYGEDVKEFLRKLLDDDDKDIRIFAINILGDVRYEDSVDMLRYLLTKETATPDPDINVIMTAVDYIGEIGSSEDISLLEAIKMEFDEPYVAFGIDTAISRIKG